MPNFTAPKDAGCRFHESASWWAQKPTIVTRGRVAERYLRALGPVGPKAKTPEGEAQFCHLGVQNGTLATRNAKQSVEMPEAATDTLTQTVYFPVKLEQCLKTPFGRQSLTSR